MMLSMLEGSNFTHDDWTSVLRRIVPNAEVGESGQVPTSNAAVAPNLGSRCVSGQDVGVRSGMCTPFSGGYQVRAGEATMGVGRAVVSNTVPNPPGNPEQSLRPVLASSGRDDSGGVSQVLSPGARAGFLQQLLDPGQAGGGPAGSHVLVNGANVSGLGSHDRASGTAVPAFSTISTSDCQVVVEQTVVKVKWGRAVR